MAILDVLAPMTGTVKELLVSVGDRVGRGQEVAVLESMKMEIPVESPHEGTVTEVTVAIPQRIEQGDLLLRLEA